MTRIFFAAAVALLLCFPFSVLADQGQTEYQQAADNYRQFKKSADKQKYHHNWDNLIQEFQQVALSYPDSNRADDAWYMAGKLALSCYAISFLEDDLETSLAAFHSVATLYPKSNLADDARFMRGEVFMMLGDKASARREYALVAQDFPRGDMAGKAKAKLKELPPEPPAPPEQTANLYQEPEPAAPVKPVMSRPISDTTAQLLSIRFRSVKDYTRIVLDLDHEVPYLKPHPLNPDPELGTPPRMYVDFKGAVLSAEFREQHPYVGGCYDVPIGDGLLLKVRAAQYQQDTVRVVLDIDSIKHYRAFPLMSEEGHYRYVIDVFGEKDKVTPLPPDVAVTEPETKPDAPKVTAPAKPIPKTIVVIDPGHGGKDPGAIGHSGVKEKNVTLELAKRLKVELEKNNPNIDVRLTRTSDRYITLVDRTSMANELDAALFVSLHCNFAKSSQASGIETFYLDNTNDKASLRLASKENFASEKVIRESGDETNQILADLIQTTKVDESIPLAHNIQTALVKTLSGKYSGIKDRGVKKAPFWVLVGATMPCVLVEINFLSNKTEEKRLNSASYQALSSKAVAQGIALYIKDYPTINLGRGIASN